MKTVYYGLNADGLWIWFKNKQAIRNCKCASEICGETITQFCTAPLFFQIFRFFLKKEYKRGE